MINEVKKKRFLPKIFLKNYDSWTKLTERWRHYWPVFLQVVNKERQIYFLKIKGVQHQGRGEIATFVAI